MFVARFVAAAFWRGCRQIFVAAGSCATKVRNKSLRVSSGLEQVAIKILVEQLVAQLGNSL